MSSVFGASAGKCDNCGRLLYEHNTRYWVKIQHDVYLLCDNCAMRIEPKKRKGKPDDRTRVDR